VTWRGRVARGSASGALTWAAACAFVYWRAFGRRRYDPRRGTPADFGVPHETFEVSTADGVPLIGWYLPGDVAAAVIVGGGYRGHLSEVLGISSALQRAGFHVVVFGWRGTPGSGSAAHTLGVHERRDLSAVIENLAARLGDVPIGLLGYSMGGAVAISVAAGDRRVRAVCTDSAFADPTLLMHDRVRRTMRLPAALLVAPVMFLSARRTGARLSDFRPVRVVDQIAPRPLLIIHGEDDASVPVGHARRLAEAAPAAQLWLLPGVGHVGAYFVHRAEYVERVLRFFRRSLLEADPDSRE